MKWVNTINTSILFIHIIPIRTFSVIRSWDSAESELLVLRLYFIEIVMTIQFNFNIKVNLFKANSTIFDLSKTKY